MAIIPVVMYPDPRLHVPCSPVGVFDDQLTQTAQDLLDTMRAAPGIGVTAAHVGLFIRLVVIELPDGNGTRYYVNPQVDHASEEIGTHDEGSISMPGVTAEIRRPASIRATYQDLSGASHHEEASGLLAICLQHEIDQINGIFWTRHLSAVRRDQLNRRYQKIRRQS